MIDFTAIDNVVARIAEIESQVGLRRPSVDPAISFDQHLQEQLREMKQPPATPKDIGPAHDNVGSGNGVSLDGLSASVPPNVCQGLIKTAAEKYGLDPRLLSAVAEVESGFNQAAVSPVGAIGVMQLMPSTAAALGVNPYDAAQNIDGGAHYLRQQLDSFGGDVRKALAAYNAGPQAVRDHNGIPPYAETEMYVATIMDLYR